MIPNEWKRQFIWLIQCKHIYFVKVVSIKQKWTKQHLTAKYLFIFSDDEPNRIKRPVKIRVETKANDVGWMCNYHLQVISLVTTSLVSHFKSQFWSSHTCLLLSSLSVWIIYTLKQTAQERKRKREKLSNSGIDSANLQRKFDRPLSSGRQKIQSASANVYFVELQMILPLT